MSFQQLMAAWKSTNSSAIEEMREKLSHLVDDACFQNSITDKMSSVIHLFFIRKVPVETEPSVEERHSVGMKARLLAEIVLKKLIEKSRAQATVPVVIPPYEHMLAAPVYLDYFTAIVESLFFKDVPEEVLEQGDEFLLESTMVVAKVKDKQFAETLIMVRLLQKQEGGSDSLKLCGLKKAVPVSSSTRVITMDGSVHKQE